MENVAIINNKYNESEIENALAEYKNDFDIQKLALHRRMFFDILDSRKLIVTSLGDVVTILRKDKVVRDLGSEYTQLIQILLLTIPVTSCTAERSFYALKELKTYLCSTMQQVRLNAAAILHVHSEIAETLDINALMDEFIIKNKIRSATFALRN